ncbi:MAG: hypothetical protein QOE70_1333 [Chthoniobacter sp.]|jgi:tetratricopeptide (TPR) repeat protein|nr:hypothetical protein [Chthoniobacter sp.]
MKGWATIAAWLLSVLMASAQPVADHSELLTRENIVDAARPREVWQMAAIGQALYERDRLRTGGLSRASLRLTNLAVLRMNELTVLELLPPEQMRTKPTLDLKGGSIFFFSREKPQELHLRTPLVTGALRGTEFHAEVGANGRTVVTMFEGEVALQNAFGGVVIRSGEQATVEPGRPPVKTAMIEAINIIQWCLYYPGVVDVAELGLSPAAQQSLAASLKAYRQGDLLGALQAYPAGRTPGSEAERIYRAALLLEVGQVDKASAELARLRRRSGRSEALKQLIAAVKFKEFTRIAPPQSATEWMAVSYYEQSRSNLEAALQAAREATQLSPEFGFAWARLAELEFSFGHTLKAMKILERALELAPSHAQAYALQGFVLSAENRLGAAQRSFEKAIALDGALGNAWLGRGLAAIRHGDDEKGRQDLQTAAALEPNRSVFRSYLGKAFSEVGNVAKANRELDRAKELDPNDPTPWLYSAIEKKQENRYNAAIEDLEKSIAANDNRRVYRSQFLLDQDRAIRGANLAAIYQNDGMIEQSVREATRAVSNDYSSAPAHLFLANSYDALRDPNRIQVRYETAWFNELLLANLLSPVGGGPLSQFASEQEYSKLFEKDGFGINSVTTYFSTGEVRETGSQYGTSGNVSYALDAEYQYNDGLRPNNRISRFESYGSFKLQLGPQDTMFFQTKIGDLETGYLFQHYDQREVETIVRNNFGTIVSIPNRAALTFDFSERQDPALLLVGWHHEWSPGNHTLLLGGRLENRQRLTADDVEVDVVARNISTIYPLMVEQDLRAGRRARDHDFFASLRAFAGRTPVTGISPNYFDLEYRSRFEAYTGELQQILTAGPNTIVAGGRFQRGDFETRVRLTNFANGQQSSTEKFLDDPPANQRSNVDFERLNAYCYDLLRVTRWLTLTGGVTYDRLQYPENFQNSPVSDRQRVIEKVSPKAGLSLQPWSGAAVRGAYSEAISGTSFDESVRLEPVQVAGFLQAYRSTISESLIGAVPGNRYRLGGASFEQRFPSHTYLAVEYQTVRQKVDRVTGSFDQLRGLLTYVGYTPSSLTENLRYREDTLTATLNQLAGDCSSFGARYRYVHSRLERRNPELVEALARMPDDALAARAKALDQSGLHALSLYAIFNHPSGFFARAEANWYRQQSDSRSTTVIFPEPGANAQATSRLHNENLGLPGEDFWQFDVFAGYRFYRNQCELGCGLLNLSGADYRLFPLNPYLDLPRDRTFVLRCKLNF